MIKERINKLLEKAKNDPDVLALVQEMVDACANYVDTVVKRADKNNQNKQGKGNGPKSIVKCFAGCFLILK